MDLIISLVLTILNAVFPGAIEDVFKIGTIEDCVNQIEDKFYDLSSNIVFSDDSLVLAVLDMLVPIGICLCVVYWAIHLAKTLNYKDPSVEMIYKSFIRLIIGCILISNIGVLAESFLEFSHILTEELGTALNTDYNNFEDFDIQEIYGGDFDTNLTYLTEGDSTQSLISVVDPNPNDDNPGVSIDFNGKSALRLLFSMNSYMIYVILFWALEMSVIFSGLTMTFDLARKVAFAPLVCCDIFEPMHMNKAFTYVRQLFAICMTQPVALIIMVSCTKCLNWVHTQTVDGFAAATTNVIMILLFTTLIGLIMSAKGVAHKLFG